MVKFLPQLTIHQNWRERLLMEAILEGRVASEMTLNADDGGSSYDVLSYRSELNVQVQDVRRGSFQFYVGGENQLGAVLLVRTDKSTIDLSQERLRVMVDGQEMRLVEEPVELLYEDPEVASYGVFTEGDAQQMLVYLPAGMLGTITVEGVDPLSNCCPRSARPWSQGDRAGGLSPWRCSGDSDTRQRLKRQGRSMLARHEVMQGQGSSTKPLITLLPSVPWTSCASWGTALSCSRPS